MADTQVRRRGLSLIAGCLLALAAGMLPWTDVHAQERLNIPNPQRSHELSAGAP